MYCPSCGSNNQDEVKFCTRCGTNLEVVSDALSGRTTSGLKLAGPFLLGFPEKMIPIVILSLGFLLLSLIAFVWGLVKWNNSSSEIKALGFSLSKVKALAAAPEQLRLPAEQSSIGTQVYATDPIALQSSVTEHTTHLLDESDQTPPTQAR